VFKFNDNFIGRAQEIGNFLVSGILREPVFKEIHDFAIACISCFVLCWSGMCIDKVRCSFHNIRLHLAPVLFLLQFVNGRALEHVGHLSG
jgi:hypothetical protein